MFSVGQKIRMDILDILNSYHYTLKDGENY